MNTVDMSGYNDILPIEKLKSLAENHADAYKTASPHAHAVFDDVFEPSVLKNVIQEFDERESADWREFDTTYEKKLQLSNDEQLGPYARSLIHNLNSEPFLNFLEALTGIPGLIPDPYLSGGGLHKIEPGGKLGIHIDFNRNDKISTYRRINVLVYLNEDWEDIYGGHFELWSDKEGNEKKKILPIFNRMAIFNTTASSFHGHPEPLNCPPDRTRKSLALYYYTVDPGDSQSDYKHNTVFVNEKGETEQLGKGKASLASRLKNKVKHLLG